jgi:hypothetical protein
LQKLIQDIAPENNLSMTARGLPNNKRNATPQADSRNKYSNVTGKSYILIQFVGKYEVLTDINTTFI